MPSFDNNMEIEVNKHLQKGKKVRRFCQVKTEIKKERPD